MAKKIALALVLVLVAAVFSGCGQSGGSPDTETEPKIFKWISSGEDNCINPHDSSAAANYEVVDLIQVSLYDFAPAKSGGKAVLIPALADGEPTTEDGYTWVIKVNPDAKWANGEAIDANTFIYSWKMALDPILLWSGTSNLAEQYISVANAMDYYLQLGTAKDGSPNPKVQWEDVGFKAVDSRTLEITTAQRYTVQEVMRHFSSRASSPVYEPVYEACMNQDRTANSYGTALDKFMGCGPFTLTHWVKSSARTFVRNENFINADMVKIDGIACRVVTDEATRLQLFESGESDYVELGAGGIEKYAENPRTRTYDQKTIRTIEVNRSNPDKAYLSDPLFRKALYHAIDREAIAALTNTTAAPYFLSTWGVSFDDGTTYRSMDDANSWLPENSGYNPGLALECFDQVLEKYGLGSIELSLHYTEAAGSLRAASEYIQSQLPKIFGEGRFALSLKAIQHTAALDLMRTSNNGPTAEWDLCWSGWGLAAETYEPHKKFAPYRSTASNRYTPYSNAFLDENYDRLLTEEYRFDLQKTFELTVEIEKSIILDDFTCIPVIQEKNYVMFSPGIVLCVDEFTPSLGFGWEYMDIDR